MVGDDKKKWHQNTKFYIILTPNLVSMAGDTFSISVLSRNGWNFLPKYKLLITENLAMSIFPLTVNLYSSSIIKIPRIRFQTSK